MVFFNRTVPVFAAALVLIGGSTRSAWAQDVGVELPPPFFGDINGDGVPDLVLIVDVNDIEMIASAPPAEETPAEETPTDESYEGPLGPDFAVRVFRDPNGTFDTYLVVGTRPGGAQDDDPGSGLVLGGGRYPSLLGGQSAGGGGVLSGVDALFADPNFEELTSVEEMLFVSIIAVLIGL